MAAINIQFCNDVKNISRRFSEKSLGSFCFRTQTALFTFYWHQQVNHFTVWRSWRCKKYWISLLISSDVTCMTAKSCDLHSLMLPSFPVSVIQHPLRLNDGSLTSSHACDFKWAIICHNVNPDIYFMSPNVLKRLSYQTTPPLRLISWDHLKMVHLTLTEGRTVKEWPDSVLIKCSLTCTSGE